MVSTVHFSILQARKAEEHGGILLWVYILKLRSCILQYHMVCVIPQ